MNRLHFKRALAYCQRMKGYLTGRAVKYQLGLQSQSHTFCKAATFPRSLESKPKPAAENSRISDVRATKNRLEVIEKQLVCQILNVELKVH